MMVNSLVVLGCKQKNCSCARRVTVSHKLGGNEIQYIAISVI